MQAQNDTVTHADVEEVIQNLKNLKNSWETVKTKAKCFSFYADNRSFMTQILRDDLITLAKLFDCSYETQVHYNKLYDEEHIERFFYLHDVRVFSIRDLKWDQQTSDRFHTDLVVPEDPETRRALCLEIEEALQSLKRNCEYFLKQTGCISVDTFDGKPRVHLLNKELQKLANQINEEIQVDSAGRRKYFYIEDVKFFALIY